MLKEALSQGKFAVTAEVAPPKGVDFTEVIEVAHLLKGKVDGVNVTDFQSAVLRATSLVTCHFLHDHGLDPIFQMTGRDRNRIAIQGELMAAYLLGIRNVLALTGDHPFVGDHKGAKPVFDLDSIGILQAGNSLRNGKDMAGNTLKGTPDYFLGAIVTPFFDPLEAQILKMEKKIEAGAEFFQTQAVYDLDTVYRFRNATRHLNTKVLMGVVPLKSAGMAKFMNGNVPGIYVPDEIINRIAKAEKPVGEGIKIAAEFIKQLKSEGLCDGVHIMAIGGEKNVPRILEAAGLL